MTHPLANFMKRFFSHDLPIQKGLATNTLLAYRDTIKLLVCFAADTLRKSADELSVEEIDENLVLAFLDHLENVRSCTSRTRNARVAAIRVFFGFIAREEPVLLLQCQRIRAIPLKRTEHKKVEYLEENEMQTLLDAVDNNARTAVRDRALLLLLYNTGARVSEVVGIKIKDLRLQDAAAQVSLLGKGKKHRSCPLWTETVQALQAYLRIRTTQDTSVEQLFLNANGGPVTRFGIRHILRKYATFARKQCPSMMTKAVNPHTLRHTTAMHLLRAGNDINMVSYWLGHADINTTHIYVEIDMDMKRKMLEKANAPLVSKDLPWQRPDVLKWLATLGK
ncbi:MAG: tyrosine-type recombinase/integrase [Desulfuromonadaceae bacterium]